MSSILRNPHPNLENSPGSRQLALPGAFGGQRTGAGLQRAAGEAPEARGESAGAACLVAVRPALNRVW
eukprot:3151785-Prymnesium_polylepis.1